MFKEIILNFELNNSGLENFMTKTSKPLSASVSARYFPCIAGPPVSGKKIGANRSILFLPELLPILIF
jgi:hypothetical protein